MIALWMMYSIMVSALLAAAGLAAERVALAMRLPTRWIWAAALGCSLTVSGAALLNVRSRMERAANDTFTTVNVDPNRHASILADNGVRSPRTIEPSHAPLIAAARRWARQARDRVNAVSPAQFDAWSDPLLVLWCVASAAALLYVGIALASAHRLGRQMQREIIDGHPVLLSRNIGPALIGIVRARVVLPRWALSLGESDRLLILTHEAEHAAAHDPALLIAAVVAGAIQAWNVPLWFMVSRLRFAIEADCDARVLARAVDVRSYGNLLIRVHARGDMEVGGRLAFVGTTSRLEARIRRIAGPRPHRVPLTLAAACGALVLTACAYLAPAPRLTVPTSKPSALRSAPATPAAASRAETAGRPGAAAAAGSTSALLENARTVESAPEITREASVATTNALQGTNCGRASEGFVGPTFSYLRQLARQRHADLFATTPTRSTVIAFAVDGMTCAILRDTVLTIPVSGSYSANVLYARAFPELPPRSPEIGLGDALEEGGLQRAGNPALMILYAMTGMPATNRDCEGVSEPQNGACSSEGRVIIRVLDSVRVLVGVYESQGTHLFMFTSAEPVSTLLSRSIQLGHVEYGGGALYVVSRSGSDPSVSFSVADGKPKPVGARAVWRFDNGRGLSHYAPMPLSLDAVLRLKPSDCRDSAAPAGSCFEADGTVIRFPL